MHLPPQAVSLPCPALPCPAHPRLVLAGRRQALFADDRQAGLGPGLSWRHGHEEALHLGQAARLLQAHLRKSGGEGQERPDQEPGGSSRHAAVARDGAEASSVLVAGTEGACRWVAWWVALNLATAVMGGISTALRADVSDGPFKKVISHLGPVEEEDATLLHHTRLATAAGLPLPTTR